MSAAALSAVNSKSALQQYVGISMLKKSNDIQQEQSAGLLAAFDKTQQNLKQINASIPLQVGSKLDVRI